MKITANVTKNGIVLGSIGVIRNYIEFGWDQQVLFLYNEFINKVTSLNKNDYKPQILQSYMRVCKRLKIITEIRNEPMPI